MTAQGQAHLPDRLGGGIRMLRRAGWILVTLAALCAIGSAIFQGLVRRDLLELPVVLAMLLGVLALVISSVVRLVTGQVKLRLWDAAKSALGMFSVMMAAGLVVGWLFPQTNGPWTRTGLMFALWAIGSGLYVTAYRKPE